MAKMFASLAEFETCVNSVFEQDKKITAKAIKRQNSLTKPQGSLGTIEDIAVFIAGWQGCEKPVLSKVTSCVFAGNHSITAKNVSAFPSSVTQQMVDNFKKGGAAINQLCNLHKIELNIVPIRLSEPVADFSLKPAMSKDELLEAINIGADAIDENSDLFLPGEMGIGNTTSAAAICSLLFEEEPPQKWVGAGSGLSPTGVQHKIEVVENSCKLYRDFCRSCPLCVLRCVGGREIAAVAASIAVARSRRIPVLLDGFIVCAAAAVLYKINSHALSHCLAAHLSVEQGHSLLLEKFRLQPILQLNMRLGEASGAALAFAIVKASLALHNGMASFENAGVDTKK